MSSTSSDQRLQRLVERVLPGTLPAFLLTQRWFGGKARPVEHVNIADFAWLPGEPMANGLCIADVAYKHGPPQRYALVLGRRVDPGDLPVVASPGDLDPAWLVEATADPEGAYALMAGCAATADLHTFKGGRLRFADATRLTAQVVADRPAVRPVGVEQSNTSVRLGPALVFKLLRRLEEGENPELEIGRFLTTRTAFRSMPALHGSLTYADANGHDSTVAIVQSWIDSQGDGWSHVLAALSGRLHGENDDRAQTLGDELTQLGQTTAAFHAAMASSPDAPGFAPETASAADVRSWATGLETQAATALELLAGARVDSELKDALAGAIGTLAGAGSTAAPSIGLIEGDGFPKIRIHGDYHLGQTLKTDDGFVLLDFEGEPARSLAERQLKQCALKDVAGMLRSFEYALATACHGDLTAAAALESAIQTRSRFLDGYLSTALNEARPVVPTNAEARAAWTRFFELEKALYELSYEVNNRPDWAHIPARGILRLLGR